MKSDITISFNPWSYLLSLSRYLYLSDILLTTKERIKADHPATKEEGVVAGC